MARDWIGTKLIFIGRTITRRKRTIYGVFTRSKRAHQPFERQTLSGIPALPVQLRDREHLQEL